MLVVFIVLCGSFLQTKIGESFHVPAYAKISAAISPDSDSENNSGVFQFIVTVLL
jgi:hypothetical protein